MEKSLHLLPGVMEEVYSPGSFFSVLCDFVKHLFISLYVRHV